MEYLENKFFLLAFTFGVFFLSRVLQKKTGWVVLNPILLTIAVLILFLKFTGISYEIYNEGGHLIEFWLKPAVVALGVPLYLQLEMIKKQLLPIVISQLAGCLVGLVAVVVIAKLLGATPEIICSLAPKSVTWLKPAVVALGVPLYLQLEMIKKQLLPIVISQLAGCLVGLVAVVVIAKLLGATPEIICSLAPKSVTTPIAMEVSKATGGIPSLTAAVVVVVGLFGAVFGFKVLRVGHVGSPIAQGLSMGTATHAVGTSTAMEISGKYGAYASLGLTLNGIMTAIFTPTILRLLGVI